MLYARPLERRYLLGARRAGIVSISSTKRVRSSMRNRARPFPMTSIRSAPATSVQPAGTDLKHPPSSWKYTRSPFQSWRCSKTSSTRPFQGWNGCVTRHPHTSSVGSGVVNTCFLNFLDHLGPAEPALSVRVAAILAVLVVFATCWVARNAWK